MKPDRAGTPDTKKFGLRFRRNRQVVCLIQISGSGRLLLEDNHGKRWWSKPPLVEWEIYKAAPRGQLYDTEDSAKEVVHNLSRLACSERGKTCSATSQNN